MSIYSFHENASSASALGGTEIVPINQSGVIKQITSAAMLSLAPVNTTATALTVTQAAHGNRVVTVSSAVPIAITLPQATGTGTKYRFVYNVAATATSSTILVANATDCFQGVYTSLVTGTATHQAFAAVASATTGTRSDTMSFNGTTTGGAVGLDVEIHDIATGYFQVRAFDPCVSTTTTPFSAGV